MFTCYVAKSKGTLTPVPCKFKTPVKKNTIAKTPTVAKPSVSRGNPGSALKAVTGGKPQAKPVAKSGAMVFAEDNIQAKRKPTAKEAAAKKALARDFIGDFGMIKVAKDSGKDMKRSIWGISPIPTNPANAKQGQGKR